MENQIIEAKLTAATLAFLGADGARVFSGKYNGVYKKF